MNFFKFSCKNIRQFIDKNWIIDTRETSVQVQTTVIKKSNEVKALSSIIQINIFPRKTNPTSPLHVRTPTDQVLPAG